MFTVVYHRPSGRTHLLTEPAPEILAALADAPRTAEEIAARLATAYEVVDPDPAALAERVAELLASGLIEST